MVVDASAILAIFLEETDARLHEARLAAAESALISAVNYWEVLVKARLAAGADGARIIAQLLQDLQVGVEVADGGLAEAAAEAFERYRGRPARLNLGDCFAYALAQREGDGLLFKGDDFSRTDVKSALTP